MERIMYSLTRRVIPTDDSFWRHSLERNVMFADNMSTSRKELFAVQLVVRDICLFCVAYTESVYVYEDAYLCPCCYIVLHNRYVRHDLLSKYIHGRLPFLSVRAVPKLTGFSQPLCLKMAPLYGGGHPVRQLILKDNCGWSGWGKIQSMSFIGIPVKHPQTYARNVPAH